MDIPQLKQLKVLVLGDSCEDVYHYGICEKLSPEAPVPVFKHKRSESIGGMAKNVFNNLAGLGCQADLITNKNAISKERFIDEDSLQHVVRVDMGEYFGSQPISTEDIRTISYSSYDAVIISDYEKGFIDHNAGLEISNICQENNIPLFVDSKKVDLSCFNKAIIKINEHENEKVKKFPKDYELVVTKGSLGASYNDKLFPAIHSNIDNLQISRDYKRIRNGNICGAGDSFIAGLACYYVIYQNLDDAINFGNKCAAVAVSNFGTHPIKVEELI